MSYANVNEMLKREQGNLTLPHALSHSMNNGHHDISSLGWAPPPLRFWESVDDDHLCGVWGVAWRCAPRSFRMVGRRDAVLAVGPRRRSSELVEKGFLTLCNLLLDKNKGLRPVRFAERWGQAPTPPFFNRFARDGGKPPYPHCY